MTTTVAYHRHDSSDSTREILEPILPGGPGIVECPARNNRRFTLCSGFSVPAHPGATCLRTTAAAAPLIDSSAAGGRNLGQTAGRRVR